MNKIRQHRPSYFSGFKDLEVEFDSADALLEIPWVKNFAGAWDGDTFHRFSISRDKYSKMLICELNDGKKWWVIGYLEHDVPTLPTWKGIYES